MTSSDSKSSRQKDALELTDATSEEVVSSREKAPPTAAAPNNQLSGFWPVFLSTFVTIFLAELGDKTQVTTMLMSAESKAPVVVFLGAGLALISTSLIGVLLGQWLSKQVSEKTLDIWAGILLLLISVGLVGDIIG